MEETIYTPTSGFGFGVEVWRDMFSQALRSRELVWRLFLRNLAARYRQSVLGYVWAILPAVVTAVVATYFKNSRAIPIADTPIPYPLYVLLGMSIWQFFAAGLALMAGSLVAAGSLVTKVNFARETLVFAALGQSLLDLIIRLVIVAGAFVLFRMAPEPTILFLPFALIPLVLMTLGLGFLLALANGVFRDVSSVLSQVVMFGLFFTPVLYPPPTQWPGVLINYLNPVSQFLIAAQDLTAKGYFSQPLAYTVSSLLGLAIFLIGWRVFHVAMPRVAERI